MGRFLEDTILSIANQSFTNFEHIVIDGGSTDGSLDILKKYPYIRWISEKDNGYPDAMRKAIKMARGKYVLQCCSSDALANINWLRDCYDCLSAHKDVSLVFGLPQALSENGIAGKVAYTREFRQPNFPQKENIFYYWLSTFTALTEGNLCVSKKILEECYLKDGDDDKVINDWLQFTYNFFSSGHLAYFLPVAANFGRVHDRQIGEQWHKNGTLSRMRKLYNNQVRHLRCQILSGQKKVDFVDPNGQVIGSVNRMKVILEFMKYFVFFNINRIINKAERLYRADE